MSKATRSQRTATQTLTAALQEGSDLRELIQPGLAGLGADKSYVDQSIRGRFLESLNLDAAMRAAHPNEHRWDYLLGLNSGVVGVEPHSAKQDEVSTVIRKRESALQRLTPHLKAGANISHWFWVASGDVHFADTAKEKRRLEQAGITFVGRRLLAKHLPT